MRYKCAVRETASLGQHMLERWEQMGYLKTSLSFLARSLVSAIAVIARSLLCGEEGRAF